MVRAGDRCRTPSQRAVGVRRATPHGGATLPKSEADKLEEKLKKLSKKVKTNSKATKKVTSSMSKLKKVQKDAKKNAD